MQNVLHPPGTFCWNELGTRNAAAAKKFYSAMFGWQTHDDSTPMGVYTLLRLDGQDIGGLYELNGPQFEGVPSHWMPYVATADCNATTEKIRGLGGQVLMGPMDVPEVGRMTVAQDPQGAAFSIMQFTKHCGAAQLGQVPGTFCWNELGTNDTAAARKFYTGVFGWGAKEMPLPNMVYTVWQSGGQDCGGMYPILPEMGPMPPNWMSYVTVADCDAGAQKAQGLGATIVVPPTDIPNIGRFAIFADPTGAHLSIISFPR